MAILRNPYPENTPIPTSIFKLALYDLTPRDICVLLHLFVSPNGSTFDSQEMAEKLNINALDVNQAFKALHQNGLASYKRGHTGQTEWTINLSSFEGRL